MKTVLVTGANRGLGLEFCRQYAGDGWRVIAACRDPQGAQILNTLAASNPNIEVEALDVADFSQIDALAGKLNGQAIDILLNNAGVYGDQIGHGFGNLDYAAWQTTLNVNSIAPIKMAEAFVPHLLKGSDKLIATVSSLMGSLADNSSGGSLLYRSSKAAVNAAMHSLAIDLQPRSIGVLILHPGWVRTDMGGPDALIDVETSVSGMRRRIAEFALPQSGSFIRYDGNIAPW